MTTNQTIDGVPRRLIERAITAAHIADCPALRDELRALLDAEQPAPVAVQFTQPFVGGMDATGKIRSDASLDEVTRLNNK